MKDFKDMMKQEYISAVDIPEIDLYVDQIITLLEGNLGKNKRTPNEKVITKTMVNNYSKDGMLKRIKGKKYSKQHIMMILLICGLKRGMAVQDIARIFAGLEDHLSGDQEGYDKSAVEEMYADWGETGQIVTETLPEYAQGLVDRLSKEGDDPLPAIMVLTEIAAQCSRSAQMLIDESFPQKKK
ncbi:MAG: DUF1836 domain-containing protein [Oscillospiraceae bacterium]|nr:DUF1836 domain-containing protein [Oscillospiraceae bacterium]